MAMRAKRKCKRDDSDSESNDIDSNSDGCDEKRGGGGEHGNMGDHSAASTSSVPAEALPASDSLARLMLS